MITPCFDVHLLTFCNNAMSLVLRTSFIFSLIIHLIFRSLNLVTVLLLCVNNFGIGDIWIRWYLVYQMRVWHTTICVTWCIGINLMSNPQHNPMRKRFAFVTAILFVVAIMITIPFNGMLPSTAVAQQQRINSNTSSSRSANSSASNPLPLKTIFKQVPPRWCQQVLMNM